MSPLYFYWSSLVFSWFPWQLRCFWWLSTSRQWAISSEKLLTNFMTNFWWCAGRTCSIFLMFICVLVISSALIFSFMDPKSLQSFNTQSFQNRSIKWRVFVIVLSMDPQPHVGVWFWIISMCFLVEILQKESNNSLPLFFSEEKWIKLCVCEKVRKSEMITMMMIS